MTHSVRGAQVSICAVAAVTHSGHRDTSIPIGLTDLHRGTDFMTSSAGHSWVEKVLKTGKHVSGKSRTTQLGLGGCVDTTERTGGFGGTVFAAGASGFELEQPMYHECVQNLHGIDGLGGITGRKRDTARCYAAVNYWTEFIKTIIVQSSHVRTGNIDMHNAPRLTSGRS